VAAGLGTGAAGARYSARCMPVAPPAGMTTLVVVPVMSLPGDPAAATRATRLAGQAPIKAPPPGDYGPLLAPMPGIPLSISALRWQQALPNTRKADRG